MKVLDLFSAACGGWSLGMHRAGFHTIAACEVVDWRRAIYSQNNPGVPIYEDVTRLNAGTIISDLGVLPDIIVGSPPCQDISSANTKGKGVDGERSGLYFEAVRLIDECRPRWFALENSANLRTRGADRVIDALEAIGYTCWPFVVSAGDVGANHPRKRSWLIGFNLRRNDLRYTAHQFSPQRHHEETPGGETSLTGGSRQDANAGGGDILSDEHAESIGYESRWSRGCRPVGDGAPPITRTDVPDAVGVRESDSAFDGEVGGSESPGEHIAEPWADWNGGLAHHLRVDDGLSAWVAESRIAVGGPRGTVAASLIVEAFGDAVVPQIPEAIGRAILRVEAALAAISAANDNTQAEVANVA